MAVIQECRSSLLPGEAGSDWNNIATYNNSGSAYYYNIR